MAFVGLRVYSIPAPWGAPRPCACQTFGGLGRCTGLNRSCRPRRRRRHRWRRCRTRRKRRRNGLRSKWRTRDRRCVISHKEGPRYQRRETEDRGTVAAARDRGPQRGSGPRRRGRQLPRPRPACGAKSPANRGGQRVARRVAAGGEPGERHPRPRRGARRAHRLRRPRARRPRRATSPLRRRPPRPGRHDVLLSKESVGRGKRVPAGA